MLGFSLQLPAQTISEISALATATLAIVAVGTGIVGFWNRAKISQLIKPWIADRVTMKRLHEESVKLIDGLRTDIEQLRFTSAQQRDAIDANAVTIKRLREEVAELRAIKKRFDALVGWLPEVFEYIAYLQAQITVKLVRQMPALPDELRDHIEIPEVFDGR